LPCLPSTSPRRKPGTPSFLMARNSKSCSHAKLELKAG